MADGRDALEEMNLTALYAYLTGLETGSGESAADVLERMFSDNAYARYTTAEEAIRLLMFPAEGKDGDITLSTLREALGAPLPTVIKALANHGSIPPRHASYAWLAFWALAAPDLQRLTAVDVTTQPTEFDGLCRLVQERYGL